mmetsp:Transcript_35688/g.65463  ORF Transcript_35688/g.65463 Transcript_35688/m.65463 type:complete len:234 (-) Transcript_35688:925-1626(-)
MPLAHSLCARFLRPSCVHLSRLLCAPLLSARFLRIGPLRSLLLQRGQPNYQLLNDQLWLPFPLEFCLLSIAQLLPCAQQPPYARLLHLLPADVLRVQPPPAQGLHVRQPPAEVLHAQPPPAEVLRAQQPRARAQQPPAQQPPCAQRPPALLPCARLLRKRLLRVRLLPSQQQQPRARPLRDCAQMDCQLPQLVAVQTPSLVQRPEPQNNPRREPASLPPLPTLPPLRHAPRIF